VKRKTVRQRINRLQDKIKCNEIQSLLVTGPANRQYISGFDGTSGALLVGLERCDLFTDFRYRQQAELQSPYCRIQPWVEDLPQSLAPVVSEAGFKQLGFEKRQLTYDLYQAISAKLEAELIPVEGFVEELRSVKEEEEIEILRYGASCLDQAFSHILNYIRPGATEQEIALELEFFLRRIGAQGISFRFIVASGERGAMPHGVASEKKLAQGEMVTIDFGAIFKAYATDMTRTVCLGEPDAKQRDVYATARNALEKAAAALKPGLTGREADATARDFITKAGYGEYFGHSLGHGVGLEAHELPILSPRAETVLEPGMTVTVEPGIYIYGWGGVRIEDMMLITANGAEALTSSTRDLVII